MTRRNRALSAVQSYAVHLAYLCV